MGALATKILQKSIDFREYIFSNKRSRQRNLRILALSLAILFSTSLLIPQVLDAVRGSDDAYNANDGNEYYYDDERYYNEANNDDEYTDTEYDYAEDTDYKSNNDDNDEGHNNENQNDNETDLNDEYDYENDQYDDDNNDKATCACTDDYTCNCAYTCEHDCECVSCNTDDNDNIADDHPDEHEPGGIAVLIIICQDEIVTIYPPTLDYTLSEGENGKIVATFFAIIAEESFTIDLPYGWQHSFLTYDATYTIVTLTPPITEDAGEIFGGVIVTVDEYENVTVYPPGLTYAVTREDWSIRVAFAEVFSLEEIEIDSPHAWYEYIGEWIMPMLDDDGNYLQIQPTLAYSGLYAEGTVISIVPMMAGVLDSVHTGNITLSGPLTLGPNAHVTGNITTGTAHTLIVQNGAEIVGNVTVNGTAHLHGTVRGTILVPGGTLFIEDGALITTNIHPNPAHMQGRGVHMTGASTVTMNGGVIEGNYAGNSFGGTAPAGATGVNGGGISANGAGAHFIMNAGIIRNNYAEGGGGAFHFGGDFGGALFEMHGGYIYNNTAGTTGGAVNMPSGTPAQVAQPSRMRMYGGIIGAVVIDEYTSTPGNSSGTNGGAINMFGGTSVLFIENGIINGNTSGGHGGGIAMQGAGAALTIENATITGNTSNTHGGAISMTGASTTTTIENAIINGNTATTYGGAISMSGATAATTIENAIASGNTSLGNGGGFSIREGSTMTISDITMANNTAYGATGGGAVHMQSTSTLTMYSGTLHNNTAYNSSGGGIILLGSSIFNIRGDVSLVANRSAGSSGGIHVGGTSQVNGTHANASLLAHGNRAGGVGGGVNIVNAANAVSITHAVISGNQSGYGTNHTDFGAPISSGGGGGVHNVGTFVMHNGEISENIAHRGGGGGLFSAAGSHTTIGDGILIYGNRAYSHTFSAPYGATNADHPGIGAGIRLLGGIASASIGSIDIINNTAAGSGGGFHLGGVGSGQGATLVLDGLYVAGNRAGSTGSGMQFGSRTNITLTNSIIERNGFVDYHITAPPEDAAVASGTTGSGIFVSDNAHVTIGDADGDTTRINHNAAEITGGGVAISPGAVVEFLNIEIAHNRAGMSGGGVHIFGHEVNAQGVVIIPGAQLNITDTLIYRNHATNHGGGINTSTAPIIVVTNSIIEHNNANGSGGGLSLGSLANTKILDSMIVHNTAGLGTSGGGGGISIQSAGSRLYLQGCTQIAHNTSRANGGGGILAAGAAGNDIAYGAVITMLDRTTIHNNTAEGTTVPSGGGVRTLGTSTFYMHGGAIFNNSAQHNGGGASIGANSTFRMFYNPNYPAPLVRDHEYELLRNQSCACESCTELDVLLPEGVSVFGNTAYSHGAGLFVSGGSPTLYAHGRVNIFDNHIGTPVINPEHGTAGGVGLRENAVFFMGDGVIICSNTAHEGAGVHVHQDSEFNMTGGVIRHNIVVLGHPGRIGYPGGGVRVLAPPGGTASFEFTGGTIFDNYARSTGGGIALGGSGNGVVNITGNAQVLYNDAWNSGGGLDIQGNGTATIGGYARIGYNRASGTGIHGMGGGIALAQGGGLFIVENASIHDNHANVDGGGILVSGRPGAEYFPGQIHTGGMRPGGRVYLTGGAIENNTSNRNGGGVQLWLNGVLTMDGGYIRGNTALGQFSVGGGVSISRNRNAIFYMRGGAITNNTANFNGGGIGFSNAPTYAFVRDALFQLVISPTGTNVTGNHAPHIDSETLRDRHSYINRPAINPSANPPLHTEQNPIAGITGFIHPEINSGIMLSFNNMDIHTNPLFMVFVENHNLIENYVQLHGGAQTPPPFTAGLQVRIYRNAQPEIPGMVFDGWDFYEYNYEEVYTGEYEYCEETGVYNEIVVFVRVPRPMPTPNLLINDRASGNRHYTVFHMPEHDVRVVARWIWPPEAALTISKVFTGNMADPSTLFDFHLYFATYEAGNRIPLAPGTTFEALVISLGAIPSENITLTIGAGGYAPFQLMHGQRIYVEDVPVGMQIRIVEQDVSAYLVHVDVVRTGDIIFSPDTGWHTMDFEILNNEGGYLQVGPHFIFNNHLTITPPMGAVVTVTGMRLLVGISASVLVGAVVFGSIKKRKLSK